MKKLIECVPNFSEGKDMSIIKQITDQIETVEGVKLLDVDPGAATNRTVVTFVGTPDEVIEAAFLAVKKASQLIDMTKHKGEHPRMGATDVCPLVPISNISMEETVEYAHKLAKRIGDELEIPVYCYEKAAFTKERRNLAYCRSGEYEGLPEKLSKPEWKPDFGPAKFNARAGATAVGARDFLVAYNINLNTTSTRRANSIAYDIRERGRVKREGNPITGKIVRDEQGNQVYIPGSLKEVKGIGWFIEEYGIAQISLNLTNISVTPVHVAFEEACKKAQERGIRVTGSELVGLIPLKAITDAGKYFLRKQQRSVGVSEDELIKIAVKSLGLDDLKPFNPKEKIIEYMISEDHSKKLTDMDLRNFANETASESPAPGGGSISAYVAALGVSLGTMVANLSSHKRGWDDRWEEFSDWAEKGQALKDELLLLVDEDTRAFNLIMDAFGMPKSSDNEKLLRTKAIQEASKYAMEIPFRVMQKSLESMEIMKAMALTGNPNSASDAGVGALCARTAVKGAFMNVKINAAGIDDHAFVTNLLEKGAAIEKMAEEKEREIVTIVEQKIKELAK
ncbi:MAG: glutamate formimidoyltransferase [Bacteroidales bacterium]|jgi:glutamate formiminotransferase/formiminotetrahydrofolate cyclodeaminase|nr:glutamate formimidoyltransferase [Bacteroidales bacterium]MDI9592063.1 glutamate formimidoyltransferase [Bacteroidota bacterium]OQC37512.1 MAG: Methenyltetrahydrofolate cyclohydrolase [Bacteroidetes bacterium ADurb.Bin041]HOF80731.1 glutamate formimidoyltransferase [Bacteroidales bacterium]HOR76075.1 glutamate formimidoyltransferase [Bacteroidales bacterium]